jgi:hypothetical protein
MPSTARATKHQRGGPGSRGSTSHGAVRASRPEKPAGQQRPSLGWNELFDHADGQHEAEDHRPGQLEPARVDRAGEALVPQGLESPPAQPGGQPGDHERGQVDAAHT